MKTIKSYKKENGVLLSKNNLKKIIGGDDTSTESQEDIDRGYGRPKN